MMEIHPQSRSASLLYQASVRLAWAMAMGVVGISLLLASIFHYSQEKAVRQEIRNTVEYFSEGAKDMERRWEESAVRYKSRLEFARLLDDPSTRWARLSSYLATQNAGEPFPAVLVADARDRVVFSFGFDEEAAPRTFASPPDSGWHYDAAGDTLYRYYVQHVWMGEDGIGHLILFRPMDNALLNNLSNLNTHLFLRWGGKTVASSLGERGRRLHLPEGSGAMEHDGMRVEQAAFKWTGNEPGSPELVIHKEIASLFDIWEIILGTTAGLVGLLAILWASIGLWLYRTAHRITLVGEASQRFIEERHPSPRVLALLEDARGTRSDEINAVARSFESLAQTVAQRESERDAYEATLRESEARIREITSVLADGVYVLDSRGIVTFVNPEAERLLGWTREELIGKNGHDTFHYKRPDGTPISRKDCLVHQTIRTGEVYRNHNDWLVRKDGSILPVSIVSSPIVREGKVTGSVAAFHDIAPRLAAEKALRESEERFRLIGTAAMDAIVIVDSEERIAYWNPAAERLFGHPAESALGQNLHDLIAPDRYREDTRRGFEHFRTRGEGKVVGQAIEMAALRSDGGEFPVELSISAFTIDGEWHALGIVRDISERKRVEHEMRETRARMRALLDASSESVLLLEPGGRILAINALGAERLGRSPEDMVGDDFFSLMPPGLAETRRAAVQHTALAGEPMQTHDQRGDIFFENSLYPVKDENGKVESVAIYAKDITEAHRNKQVEDIFRHLDTVLLKWRMDVDSVAQIFCEDILPVFDLSAVWIGRAEKGGGMRIMACAEGAGGRFLDHLRETGLHWDSSGCCCLPVKEVIESGQRRLVAFQDDTCRSCRAAMPAMEARAILLLPLNQRDETWGTLALYGRNEHQFDQPAMQMRLAAIATRLGVSLESASQQEWLNLLYSALEGVSNAVLITDAHARIIWVNRSFESLSGYGADELLGKTPSLFHSGAQDAGFYRHFWEEIKSGKTWHGEIVNARRDGSRYTANQTVTPLVNANGQVTHYVSIVEDVTERKALEAKIQHSAHFDLLTDLPNRGLFFDRLDQALALARRNGQSGALLFLDLDRFKQVNDRFGHGAGDRLLVTVAERLRSLVRESDTVARLAGDEFTIILNQLEGADGAVRVAQKILAEIARPVDVGGHEVQVGVSIGIALFPGQGASVEQILNAADQAMYQAKEAGRNGYALAGGEIPAAAQEPPRG